MQFWPINGKGIARKTVHDCIACFRQKPTGVDQLMGNLPSERVTPSAPFLNSGVDFCGPFQIKVKNQRKGIFSKVYVAIFVCLATKAIHLEAVTDLTTEAFIAALKRLCARRGRISTLMSDNATNFKGAAAELNRFIKLICNKNETLANYFASEAIQWKFIPPRSPNFGVCGRQVPLSDNINEYEVLTPGHFIIGRPISAIPEPTILDISDNRLSRWQYSTKCVQTLWKRWKNDYLNHLQQRNKWQFEKNNVTVGCLVLLKENDLPPCKWTVARILEVIYGTDGASHSLRNTALVPYHILVQDSFLLLALRQTVFNKEKKLTMSETNSEKGKIGKAVESSANKKAKREVSKKCGKFTEVCIPNGVFPIGDDVFVFSSTYYDSVSVHIRRFKKYGKTYYPTPEGITSDPRWIEYIMREKKVPE
ncbi:integrase catalytic domain-containing protein [Trichonephila clavipes]|nr:integrase catalytic domain-containing protein [Trichonephila clavipes]